MSNTPTPSKVAAKLVEASKSVRSVEKRGRNERQKYNYATIEDVASAAYEAVLAVGLLVDYEPTDARETPIKSQQGSDGWIVRVQGILHITDPESGEHLTRQVLGYGSDFPGDKAAFKGMSGGRKYALIHLLGIPIGQDPEEGTEEGRARSRAQSSEPTLPAKRIDSIKTGFAALGLSYKRIELIFGSCGVDGLRARSVKALEERISTLTEQQADAIEAALEKEAS